MILSSSKTSQAVSWMQVVVAVLGDKTRDSGYWGSARMILEAALCMATQVRTLAAAIERNTMVVLLTYGGLSTHHHVNGQCTLSKTNVQSSCDCSQREQLAADGRLQGGVLTPASALGMTLVRRLQDAGFHYEIQHG